jgi:hypothetical protein
MPASSNYHQPVGFFFPGIRTYACSALSIGRSTPAVNQINAITSAWLVVSLADDNTSIIDFPDMGNAD